ncbi:MAG: tetratricopeptide repeat protein, partial [Isosphaeraceae bacterium]
AYLQTRPTRLADHALAWLAISQWEIGKKQESAKTLKQLETDFSKSETLVPTALRLGESALEAKDLPLAAAWLELVSRQGEPGPLRARAYSGLGYVYSEMKRPADSAKAFATAAEMTKLDTPTAQESAMAASKVLENSGKFEESLAQLEKLLAVGDKLPESLAREGSLRKARLLSRAGKAPESAQAYAVYADKYLKDKPEGADQILSEWAYLLLDAGKIADADKVFERILKETPGSKMAAEARLNLAESAYSAKDYDKVKSLLAELVDAKAKGQVDESVRESAIYRLARAELDQKHWDTSRELWTRLRTDYPKSPLAGESAFWLGEIAIRTDRPEEAARILDDLLKNLPKEQRPAWANTAQLRMIQALTSQKKWDEVNKLADGLLNDAEFSKNPELAGEVHYARGRAYQGLARFDDSRKAYQAVIDARPSGDLAAKAQFMRGETYFHEKNYREALREFLKVDILHDSTIWQAAALLEGGKVYEQLNQPADAADLYKRLVDRFPNEPAAIEAKTRLVALKLPGTVR